MTFGAYEESRSLGEPDALYRFSIGDTVYSYTDAEEEITVDDVVYLPIPIDRGSVNTSGTLDKSSLAVRVPQDNPVADLFRVFPPSEVVGLVIFQGHAPDGDLEYLAIWAGRVLSSKWEDSEAILDCEPISTSMRRAGLRVRDQYQCMHALYGPSCRVSRPAFTVAATALGKAAGWVSFGPGWNGPIAADRFANGIIQWGTDQRQIIKVSGNQVKVAGSLASLEPGATVTLSRGCNHNSEHCNEFGNILNFGGCKWIPKKNPVGFVNNFY
ncbi:phage BR0599 family protein [Novosphingobium resinovorum]|uniref:Bacteriophage phiJL001 Gp84 C-terminal domain-containing protein n=1 Tax=Novosphingobium resinovorum TaxID=158500 RepID=A0A1D8A3B8_9SPHN|nr:phage BR0599 family protein [Novosphingobium resinovorum]AOR76566.1 hypothetical protein BES08_07250 [Novosphingobium resinovorum]